MTGNQYGDWVSATGAANCANGFSIANFIRDFAIAQCLSTYNGL